MSKTLTDFFGTLVNDLVMSVVAVTIYIFHRHAIRTSSYHVYPHPNHCPNPIHSLTDNAASSVHCPSSFEFQSRHLSVSSVSDYEIDYYLSCLMRSGVVCLQANVVLRNDDHDYDDDQNRRNWNHSRRSVVVWICEKRKKKLIK